MVLVVTMIFRKESSKKPKKSRENIKTYTQKELQKQNMIKGMNSSKRKLMISTTSVRGMTMKKNLLKDRNNRQDT